MKLLLGAGLSIAEQRRLQHQQVRGGLNPTPKGVHFPVPPYNRGRCACWKWGPHFRVCAAPCTTQQRHSSACNANRASQGARSCMAAPTQLPMPPHVQAAAGGLEAAEAAPRPQVCGTVPFDRFHDWAGPGPAALVGVFCILTSAKLMAWLFESECSRNALRMFHFSLPLFSAWRTACWSSPICRRPRSWPRCACVSERCWWSAGSGCLAAPRTLAGCGMCPAVLCRAPASMRCNPSNAGRLAV